MSKKLVVLCIALCGVMTVPAGVAYAGSPQLDVLPAPEPQSLDYRELTTEGANACMYSDAASTCGDEALSNGLPTTPEAFANAYSQTKSCVVKVPECVTQSAAVQNHVAISQLHLPSRFSAADVGKMAGKCLTGEASMYTCLQQSAGNAQVNDLPAPLGFERDLWAGVVINAAWNITRSSVIYTTLGVEDLVSPDER